MGLTHCLICGTELSKDGECPKCDDKSIEGKLSGL